MSLTLADGQLGTSSATILSVATGSGASDSRSVNVILTNTGGATETVIVTVSRAGGTSRRIVRFLLEAYESLYITGLALGPADTVAGYTTNASTVDYLVNVGSGPFAVYASNAIRMLTEIRELLWQIAPR